MNSKSKHNVLIGVCTYKRPKMLAKCLESLAAQTGTDDLEVCIVVVDNEPDAPGREFVEQFGASCVFPVYYRHEPKRGIAAARNAVLDAALELASDWIAFIDDDETASPTWIKELMAPEYLDTPVLGGTRIMLPPPGETPFWYVEKRKKKRVEGDQMKTAATYNVRMSIALVRAGLRFDERRALSGGEDREFFANARLKGFAIRRTNKAYTYEMAHPERLTYMRQMYGAYWQSASDYRHLLIQDGQLTTIIRHGFGIPAGIAAGIFGLVIAPLYAIRGMTAFKQRAIRSGKRIAKAIGRSAALIGILPQPYATTVGR